MKTSFSPEKPGNEGILLLWNPPALGQRPEGLACILAVCDNPGCECSDIFINAFHVDDTMEGVTFDGKELNLDLRYHSTLLQSRPQVELLVDTHTGKLSFYPDAKPEHKRKDLLHQFRNYLDRALVEVLRARFLRDREAAEEESWLATDWSYLRPGEMVPWLEVFPGADEMLFEYGETRYLVIDSYCPEPGCSCRDVMIAFAEVTEGKQGVKGKEAGALRLDTRTWRLREKHPQRLSEAAILELWRAYQREVPGIRQKVSARVKKMRRFGAVALGPRVDGTEAASLKEVRPVGRNDPCPCGSGKKYKKCCG